MGRIRVILVWVVIFQVFIYVGASAGNYHFGETSKCSDCHSTHASSQHDENGSPTTASQSPTRNLLNSDSTSNICLKCHDDNAGVPDVVGDDVNNPSEQYDGTERAAGQFEQGGGDNWKGHDLPGQGSGGPGDCTACHDPHGNKNYRNLKISDGAVEEPIAFVNPAATGMQKYSRSNVGYARNVNDMLCGRCHDFGSRSSTVSPRGNYHRHPSSSTEMKVEIGGFRKNTDSAHWISGRGSGFNEGGLIAPRVPFVVSTATDYQSATTVSSTNEVSCLSCHKAHGSKHAFSMVWPYGGGQPAQSASGCNQCHNTTGI